MRLLTPVDRLYSESSSIIRSLQGSEPSLAIAAGDTLRKGLLLAAASHFEHLITSVVIQYAMERSNADIHLVQFVQNKAVTRQYHTWFAWGENNANHFFSLFGSQFREAMTQKVKADDALRDAIRAFMQLGSERNRLVHEDFASFPLEKTLDEIFALFQQALPFVDGVAVYLREPTSGTVQT